MAFTTPRTWVTNELVTAAMLNEQIRDNLSYLLTPNYFYLTSTSAYSTTSTSYTAVNAALTSASITLYGGHFLMGAIFALGTPATAGPTIDVAFAMDGANEIQVVRNGIANVTWHEPHLLRVAPSAGAHTFSLRWKVASGTGNMRGVDNGGTAIGQIVFWGVEI